MKNYFIIGEELTTQLVPIPQSVLDMPGRESSATQELVFKAKDLPPLGFKTYYVQKTDESVSPAEPVTGDERLNIKNEVGIKVLTFYFCF